MVAWHVQVGDMIEEDARLADVMTDKATVELESPVAGRVLELAGVAGDRLAIGSPLVVLEVEGDEAEQGPSTGSGRAEGVSEVRPAQPRTAQPEPVEGPSSPTGTSMKVLASPAVRARAAALGIDLGKVPAGPDGRIGHGDLDALLLRRQPVDKSEDKPEQKPVDRPSGAGRDDQGHRPEAQDCRSDGGFQAPYPALFLCRGMRCHRAGSFCAAI